MIGQGGHQVIHASNGAEAMDHLDKQSVDLCFLQDTLPNESGLEFCQTYTNAAETERIPIVIFRANRNWNRKHSPKERPTFSRCLAKPRKPWAWSKTGVK